MSEVTEFLQRLAEAQRQAWNRWVPKCAVDVEMTPTHVRYLHPTRGWKRVSRRKVGL